MKILHVITGLSVGGAEGVLERLVRADASNSHSIVSLHEEGPVGRRLKAEGFDIQALELSSGNVPGPLVLARLWRMVRHRRPDVVQCWMYHANLVGGLVGRAAGVRGICWNIRRSSFQSESLPGSTRAVARVGAWLSSILPDTTVYCARAAARGHVAAGYDDRRLAVIRNGVDTDRFTIDPSAGAAIREELGIPGDAVLIGSVGRFNPDKDHETLFGALARLAPSHPGLRCVLAGQGVALEDGEVTELARRSGVSDRLVLLGPRDDLPAVLNAIDLHVSSSVTEGFPNVLAEAMACGTPCVSTDVGDAAAIIGDHGWLVPAREPARLAAAIDDALNVRTTDRWEALRRSARSHCVDNFALERMIAEYKKVWASAGDG